MLMELAAEASETRSGLEGGKNAEHNNKQLALQKSSHYVLNAAAWLHYTSSIHFFKRTTAKHSTNMAK